MVSTINLNKIMVNDIKYEVVKFLPGNCKIEKFKVYISRYIVKSPAESRAVLHISM